MPWSDYTRTPRTDQKRCRRLLRNGSRSFFAASLLLPQPMRDAAISLYAFCRLADDAIDDSEYPRHALSELRQRVDDLYRGDPRDCAADRSLALVVRQYGIPRELIDALLEGFAWDCEGRTYSDLSAVRTYSARVAGTVGVMMALLMNRRDPHVLARAADLGVAMQLTNIARDVGEDARNGRVYLPLDWFAEHTLCVDAFLAEPEPGTQLSGMLEALLAEADVLYSRAEAGIAHLPAKSRPCVMTAALLYAEIGEQVRRNGFDSISQRAVVSPGRKCVKIAGLTRLGRLRDEALTQPPLEETRFLVEAVVRSPAPETGHTQPPGRVEWALDLFSELDQRQLQRRQARAGAGLNG
jgi:phytoene synthase